MKVILIHGIHTPEKNNNMSSLAAFLKIYMPEDEIEVFSYGFMGFWEARWRNSGIAKKLAARIDQAKKDGSKVAVITHSNGAAIMYIANTVWGADPDMVVQINPALDNHITPMVKWVEVIHSNQDRAVDLAQWLPFHVWGNQGKVGYKGKARNTINHNASKFGGRMKYEDHMGLFQPSRIENWAAFITCRIEAFTKRAFNL